MSEEDRQAWETGRYGSGPPPSGGSALDAWQQGQAQRNLNEAELQRQAQAGSDQTFTPGFPTAPAAPSGGWSSGGGSSTLSGGSAATGGGLGCLLVPVLIILSLQFWALLYPLSGLASIGTAIGVCLLVHGGIPRTPQDLSTNAITIGLVAGLVVLVVTSRLEQRLGRHAAYRVPRHLVRLVLFGLAANLMLVNGTGSIFTRSGFVHLWRPFATPTQTAVVLGAVVGMHFLLWTDNMVRETWHGMLEAIRLR